jgi:hypothetical protein
MNSHILDRIASEKNKDILHSIELFIATVFVASLVGLAFFAVL